MSEFGNGPDREDPVKKLRISHAERDQVLQRLQEALGQGMITADEFTERTDAALRAKTRGEVEPLTSDLPIGPVVYDPGPASSLVNPNDVLELGSKFGSIVRKGAWQVPRKLVVRTRIGSTELDFTQARIDHPVIEIDMDVKGGSVEMRVPEGASVSMDGVDVIVGSIEDHRRNRVLSGRPHFVLTGSVRWGSVEVRGPRRNPFAWLSQ